MTEYDGYDILTTYLNGLAWTALTEPTYEEGNVDRLTTMQSNSVLVTQDAFTIESPNTGKWRWVWNLTLFFVHDVKATAFTNLEYVINGILNYNHAIRKINLRPGSTGTVRYTRSKHNFVLFLTVSELKTLT